MYRMTTCSVSVMETTSTRPDPILQEVTLDLVRAADAAGEAILWHPEIGYFHAKLPTGRFDDDPSTVGTWLIADENRISRVLRGVPTGTTR